MNAERVLALTGQVLDAKSDAFNLDPLIMALVPAFADGCGIEIFGSGMPAEKAAVWSPFHPALENPAGVVLEEAAGDGGIGEEGAALLRKMGVRAAVAIPLHHEGKLSGILSFLMTSSGRTFNEKDIAFFREIARRLEPLIGPGPREGVRPLKVARGEDLSLLARRLSHGRLERFESERELLWQRKQQQAISELAERAIAEQNLGVVMTEAARQVTEVLGVGFATVCEKLPDEDGLVVRASAGFRAEHADGYRIGAGGDSQAGFAFQSRSTVRTSDFEEERRFKIAVAPEYRLRSGIAAVIEGTDRPWGVLQAYAAEPRDFSNAEAAFLETAAHVLGQAVDRDASERQLRFQSTLLDTVGESVMAVDRARRFLYWNRHAARLHGWTSGEVVGRDALELIVPEAEREAASAAMEAVLRGEEWSGDVRLRRKEGPDFVARVTAVPLWDDGETVIGIVASSIDLTGRIHLEEQLRQAQKMEAVGRLAGGIAHDFNNLLTVISGHADLLRTGVASESDARLSAEEIAAAAARASSLTRQLLAFSRQQVLQPRTMLLRQTVHEMEDLLRRVIGENFDLVLDEEDPVTPVIADPIQIEQVILNLAVNARDAMPLGGTVTISVESTLLTRPLELGHGVLPPGRYAVLSVRDSGSGIPPEVQPHVFDPFFTTKEKGKGTGLGLATVLGIVQQSGGGIQIESIPGEGTSVNIFLPAADAAGRDQPSEEVVTAEPVDPAVPVDPATPADEPPGARGSGDEKTVLVVEDEESVRSLLRRVLPKLGYRVLEAHDGAHALQVLNEHRRTVHLVLTDVVMPIMSGPALASQLARDYADLPVVYMSGYLDDTLANQDILEVSALLRKPFTMQELSSHLEDALRAKAKRQKSG